MARLDRFEHFRFVGVRDAMTVYDCDDADQFEELQSLVEEGHLRSELQLSTFAPDELAEARNRGFHPVG